MIPRTISPRLASLSAFTVSTSADHAHGCNDSSYSRSARGRRAQLVLPVRL